MSVAVESSTPTPDRAPSGQSPESTPSGPPDVANGDLDQVLAAAQQGLYNPGASDAPPATEARETSPDPGADRAPAPAQGEAPGRTEAPAQVAELERRYQSLSGNNYQLSQTVQQLQQQLAQTQQQYQQQLSTMQEQQQRAAKEWEIRSRVGDPDVADQLVAEANKRFDAEREQGRFQQASEEYVNYARAQAQQQEQAWQQASNAQLGLWQNTMASKADSMGKFVAERTGASEEEMVAIMTSPEVAAVFPMIGVLPQDMVPAQRDMELFMHIATAVGKATARRDAQRKGANGQRAAQSGDFRGDPDGGARSAGLSKAEEYARMPMDQLDRVIEQLTRDTYARRG